MMMMMMEFLIVEIEAFSPLKHFKKLEWVMEALITRPQYGFVHNVFKGGFHHEELLLLVEQKQ